MRYRAIFTAAALLLLPGIVRAGGLTFTQDFVADFQFDVLGGTAINPGPDTGYLPYQAVGALTFTLDPAINDPTQTTVAITGVTGTLTGDIAPPGFPAFTISPDVQFLGGELTDIVRDGLGNVISAQVSDLSMVWDMVVETPTPITIVSVGGLPFEGAISSLPLSYGTVLSGDAVFTGTLVGGGPDIVVMGQDRTLTAVPEPGSGVLAGLAVALVAAVAARRPGLDGR